MSLYFKNYLFFYSIKKDEKIVFWVKIDHGLLTRLEDHVITSLINVFDRVDFNFSFGYSMRFEMSS